MRKPRRAVAHEHQMLWQDLEDLPGNGNRMRIPLQRPDGPSATRCPFHNRRVEFHLAEDVRIPA